jgi:hypothetical protein
MPGFPAWLGKYSAQNKRARLTKEIVHHTALSVGQVQRLVLLLWSVMCGAVVCRYTVPVEGYEPCTRGCTRFSVAFDMFFDYCGAYFNVL